MNRIINKIGLLLCVVVFLSGCSISKYPDELIQKPKSYSKSLKLNIKKSEFLLSDETLTLALGQKDTQSIRMMDIDGDGKDEAIVLFKENKEIFRGKNKYGIIILKQQDGKWHEINKIYKESYGIDLVEFKDLVGDKKLDIIIGWNNEKEEQKSLEIYSWSEGYFHSIYKDIYKELAIEDINNNNINELILSKKGKKNETIIDVLNYSKQKMSSVDKFVINNKNYYNTMSVGNVSPNKKGIFVDFDMGSFLSYTDLLVMENNTLVDVFNNEASKRSKTVKTNFIKSKDINNDGIIEIAISEQFPSPLHIKQDVHSNKKEKVALINSWYQWDEKKGTKFIRREYYNYDLGYKIVIPEKWGEDFEINVYPNEDNVINKVEFLSLDKNKRLDKIIFSIQLLKKETFEVDDKLLSDEYIVLKEDSDTKIVAKISNLPKESKYFIDEARLKNSFYSIKKND